jgi:hypothetical protein
MTTAPRSGARRRSLQDDLLDDLRRGPDSATSGTAASAASPPSTAPSAGALATARTAALELRITPRSWSSARWARRSDGDGLTISLGPVCLSLGLLRS